MSTAPEWSTDEDALLCKLWRNDGLSGREIGAIIGKSRSAILGRARRLDLPLRNPATAKPRSRLWSKKEASQPTYTRRVKPQFVEDSRSVTSRLMGDPLPGRSAL